MKTLKEDNSMNVDSSKKILIVSENLKALKKARTFLSSEGYAVLTVSTLDEAIELFQKIFNSADNM